MKPVTYQMLKFDKGMTPKVYTPNSATRIEHFDTVTDILRPFRTLAASTNNTSSATSVLELINFESLNDSIYAVGTDESDLTFGAIYKWDTTSFDWRAKMTFGATSDPHAMLQAHAGFLFGLRNNRYLYKMTTGGTYTGSFYDCSAFSYFCDAITHSKDGKMYFATDNKIHKVESDGTSPAIALTLPNSNYRVTSITEQGNYINIVGYDLKSGESSSLLWDRDTSVVDLTESYPLGREFVYHNANLLGTTFTIQLRQDTSNSSFQEKTVLVIKYLNGATYETVSEFPVTSFTINNGLIGGKYVAHDRMYFAARVQFDGESAPRNIIFCLDYKGRLSIAQNASINTGTNTITALLRDGESFWIGAGSDGAWNTISTYTTIASFETNDIRSDDLSMNLNFMDAIVSCEPLPVSGQILLKARKNEETTFTTIATFTETSRSKFRITPAKAKNALTGLDKARQVRFRLESTNGAVITGFQAIFNEVADDTF